MENLKKNGKFKRKQNLRLERNRQNFEITCIVNNDSITFLNILKFWPKKICQKNNKFKKKFGIIFFVNNIKKQSFAKQALQK